MFSKLLITLTKRDYIGILFVKCFRRLTVREI